MPRFAQRPKDHNFPARVILRRPCRRTDLLLGLLLFAACLAVACARPASLDRTTPLARATELLRENAQAQDPETALTLLRDQAGAGAQLARVRAFRLLGRFEEAVAEINRLIRSSPRLPEAFVERARIFYAMGYDQRALEDCAAALQLAPGDFDALLAQGDMFFAMEMPESAEVSYTRAIEAAPDNPLAFINRGVARDEQGRYAEAIADYTRAIILDPESATAFADRGVSRSQIGDMAGMCADYRRACALGQCRRLGDARLMGYCQEAR
jgi:tetratricopeptide (TPR) repeat protein